MEEHQLSVRRATAKDVAAIETFTENEAFVLSKRFGNHNVLELIENSYLSIIVHDQNNAVVGFACFGDYPYLQVKNSKLDRLRNNTKLDDDNILSAGNWDSWVHKHLDLSTNPHASTTPPVSVHNSLWLTYFIAEPLLNSKVLNFVFQTVLTTLPEIDHFLFGLRREAAPLFSPLSDVFTQLPDLDSSNNNNSSSNYAYYICSDRSYFGCPRLSIRQAREEDNDDLLPLLLAKDPVLVETKGEYFLASLLRQQNEYNKVLIAQVDGEMVGLMCLSANSDDVREVCNTYDLSPYTYLAKSEKGFHITDAAVNTDKCLRNAFRITLLVLQDEFEARSIDFIKPAFRLFASHDYCFVTVPNTTQSSPNTLITYFNYVSPLHENFAVDSLHIIHRSCFFGDLRVRKARKEDRRIIEKYLATYKRTQQQSLHPHDINKLAELIDQQESEDSTTCVMLMTMEGDDAVVGLAVVQHDLEEEEEDIVLATTKDNNMYLCITENFEVEEFVVPSEHPPHSQALVKEFSVHPNASRATRFLMREIMRKLDKSVLYYGVEMHEHRHHSREISRDMVMLPPRRKLVDSFKTLDDEEIAAQKEARRIRSSEVFSGMYITTRKLLSEPKVELFNKIVVVGASTTGLAFVNFLLRIPYLYLPNIYLLSNEGVIFNTNRGPEEPMDTIRRLFFAEQFDFHKKELMSLQGLGPENLTLIQGHLRDILRDEKRIVFNTDLEGEDQVMSYDYLVLATGRQYKLPRAVRELIPPRASGVFDLSSGHMVDELLAHVEENMASFNAARNTSTIVVYGSNLDAYCVIQALITFGVSPSSMVLVSPDEHQSVFMDVNVEEKVNKLLGALGIRCYRGYHLDKIEFDSEILDSKTHLSGNDDDTVSRQTGDAMTYVNSIHIARMVDGPNPNQKKKTVVDLQCSLFIYAHAKDIDDNMIKMINKKSLVFDGRLIVDPQFKTNDDFIYSAGPLAQISRRFGSTKPFETFNSREVGERLAQSLLGVLGVEEFQPTLTQESIEQEVQRQLELSGDLSSVDSNSNSNNNNNSNVEVELKRKKAAARLLWKLVPVLEKKLALRCVLPGNLIYFRTMLPSTPEVLADGSNRLVMRCTDARIGYNNNNNNIGGGGGGTMQYRYTAIHTDANDKIHAVIYFGTCLVREGVTTTDSNNMVVTPNASSNASNRRSATASSIRGAGGRGSSSSLSASVTAFEDQSNSLDEMMAMMATTDAKVAVTGGGSGGNTESVEGDLMCLVGVSAAYCNNLIGRYDEGLIVDFISFLRENWASVLFYDRFWRFVNSTLMRDHFMQEDEIQEIVQTIRDYQMSGTFELSDEQKAEMLRSISRTTRSVVERQLIAFLKANALYIPAVYYSPPKL